MTGDATCMAIAIGVLSAVALRMEAVMWVEEGGKYCNVSN